MNLNWIGWLRENVKCPSEDEIISVMVLVFLIAYTVAIAWGIRDCRRFEKKYSAWNRRVYDSHPERLSEQDRKELRL